MKRQIKRLSPHQNGKVAGIVIAITILPILLLMIIPMSLFPQVDHTGTPINYPLGMLILMPLIYMVFTYLMVGFGCLVYNGCQKFIGGFEIEFKPDTNDESE